MKRHGLRIIAVFLIGVFCLIGYSSAEEAQEDYDIKITSLAEVPVVDAIVLAVLHRPFREWTLAQWLRLLTENALVVDVKCGAPRSGLEKAGVRIWRL